MHYALLLLVTFAAFGAETVTVDFTRRIQGFRPLNGVNKGPQVAGGLIDLGPAWASLRVPFVRLHDCHWPNPDVVDMHAVFPRPEADPDAEASYDFRLTDEYIRSIREAGAAIIYRLGESIEHTPAKRYVHPPTDFGKWSQVCLHIIRHYNEGWANGHHWNIRYWEIWNEPENRPVMWTGSEDQYLELYRTSAVAIKKAFPQLQVGGPAVGYSGSIRSGKFVPGDFVLKFLETCREKKLPLDFFSWHCYSDSPDELVLRANGIRELLNQFGFSATESHLNEWNYLPDSDWKPILRTASPSQRDAFYRRMSGRNGAAFVASAYALLQDAPLDLAAFFHGEAGPFGFFNENGVPNEVYAAFSSIARVTAGARVFVRSTMPALASIAPDGRHGIVLLANSRPGSSVVEVDNILPKELRWVRQMRQLGNEDEIRKLPGDSSISLELTRGSVVILEYVAE